MPPAPTPAARRPPPTEFGRPRPAAGSPDPAETAEGTVVLTHAWWSVDGPAEDPTSDDHEGLRASRRKILALKPALIVPGHGDPFVPNENTPI
ncbi:hypothetical protein [Streptomyces sp. CL12-4]|uniref:hypothetical protein n=1 Tax=Streptomyces sp. CL12-4 TaxID=2810306 RepID=UPI001EFC0129|nr:hypothetical protein [Streptomyces sp. CL12-4]MCG8971588.1 hypothetical protein [Streptomyces sp. CL12-4]